MVIPLRRNQKNHGIVLTKMKFPITKEIVKWWFSNGMEQVHLCDGAFGCRNIRAFICNKIISGKHQLIVGIIVSFFELS